MNQRTAPPQWRMPALVVAMLVIATLLVWDSGKPTDEPALPIKPDVPLTSPEVAARDASMSTARRSAPGDLKLRPRNGFIGSGKDTDPRNRLFAAHSWTPPPTPKAPEPVAQPTAPPLPLTYLGKQMRDGRASVFLAWGERTFIVEPGTQLDTTYRVEAIEPNRVRLTYLPLNQTQWLTFGVTE